MAKDNRTRFVDIVGRAHNSEWISSYFDLVEYLLSETGLESTDSRLVTSLPTNGTLPVTVNNRYVLVAFRTEPSRTEFILPSTEEGTNKYLRRADHKVRFNAIYTEEEEKRPWLVGFDGPPEQIVDDEFRRLWLTAVKTEMKRAKKSPYRQYHEPIVCNTIRNSSSRDQIIREAFASI